MRRHILFALISAAISVFSAAVVLELALRLFPVTASLNILPVSAQSPVYRAGENAPFVYSYGWNFDHLNSGRVNNAGFVNGQDYFVAGPRPLIAVIGDSMIEAAMVNYAETMHGRLAAAVSPDKGRVYSFAFSGAPLSQYLIWAAHARGAYRPGAMIFNVVGNDFDESLATYKQAPGFHYYAEGLDGELELRLVTYQPSMLRRIARHSVLMRYISLNLKALGALETFKQIMQGSGETPKSPALYFGNTLADAEPQRIARSMRGMQAFFRDLPAYSGLPPEKILFVIDAIREAVYDATLSGVTQKSYLGIMRNAFMHMARERGYGVIDLQDTFARDYIKNRTRFEFETDWHWNAYGHGVVAAEIRRSEWFRSQIAKRD